MRNGPTPVIAILFLKPSPVYMGGPVNFILMQEFIISIWIKIGEGDIFGFVQILKLYQK